MKSENCLCSFEVVSGIVLVKMINFHLPASESFVYMKLCLNAYPCSPLLLVASLFAFFVSHVMQLA